MPEIGICLVNLKNTVCKKIAERYKPHSSLFWVKVARKKWKMNRQWKNTFGPITDSK